MKTLSKPLSSPSRADKFPPPLMRFLRSNVGSRSRERPRPSPIFYLRSKKRPLGGVIEATQEPSSPKVTCIGQVRVSRKENGRASGNRPRRCRCLNKILIRGKLFACRFPQRPIGSFFSKWCLIFRSNFCSREVCVAEEDNGRVYSDENIRGKENLFFAGENNKNSNRRNSISSNDSESDFYRNNKHEQNDGDESGESKMEFLEPSSSSPPKNALLLTRCRSAPYRSSSLGGRFWAEEKREIIDANEEEKKKTEELEKPNCVDDEENGRKIEKKSKN